MTTFDPGPPATFAALFDSIPDHTAIRDHFWFDWGPVFYRGRLDGTARLLVIASDPGPTERVAGRTLVGDAGQRVQGFLRKLGLTHSYLCLNAFSFALFPSHARNAPTLLAEPTVRAWRNQLFDAALTPAVQAIVAFGANAQEAAHQWPRAGGVPVVEVPHPSSRDATKLLDAWRAAVNQLRATITPDTGGDVTIPNYGTRFGEADYAPIPRADLPFGVPSWLGDDAWGRAAHPSHHNSVSRPNPDDRHTLVWIAPTT